MADFFNNPDTASTTEPYLAFGMEPRADIMSNAMSPDGGMEGDASLANTTIAHVSAAHGLYTHNVLNSTRPAFQSQDFSSFYVPDHNQQRHQTVTGGDAVAGASALLGMSTSQEQSNLLNASNYMTWGNIVAAQTVTGPNRHNTFNTMPRAPSVKSHSASQLQSHLHTPPSQPNSWAEITSQAFSQRARHPSLQLDTASTMVPNHQPAWQNAPQSAFPHGSKNSRPGLVSFGSDHRFQSQGFAGSNQHSPEPKYMHMANIGDVAITEAGIPSSSDLRQFQQSFAQQRHSIGAVQQTSHSTQSSPANISGLPTPANSVGAITSQQQTRKRGSGHLDDAPDQRRTEQGSASALKQSNKRRRSSSHQAPPEDASAGQLPPTVNGLPNTAPRNRRAGRDQKPPRQNLTDEQKRNNHIASEQKRRDAMKTNFEELNRIVPALTHGGSGLSRSEILQHTGNALESCKAGNLVIARLLEVDLNVLDQQLDPDQEDSAGDHDAIAG